MREDYSHSSASSSSSRASSPGPSIPPSPASGRPPSPDSEHVPTTSSAATLESPPPGTPAYQPHSVGIGILSPQPILGPFSPHVTRASLTPLQARQSPVQARSGASEMPDTRHAGSQLESVTQHAGADTGGLLPSASGPQPSLRLVTLATGPLAELPDKSAESPSSSSGASQSNASGLRIHLPPPPDLSSATSTSSPPLLPHASDPAFSTQPSGLAFGRTNTDTHSSAELAQTSADIDVDSAEFDVDGLSALEKIYIFARSRAGFHRTFITHALPRYLGSAAASTTPLSGEEADHISPGDAVEYILPILNGLAMDDVKEALAAELVPIIWWFITNCKLVEDDPTMPPATDEHNWPPSSLSTSPESEAEGVLPQAFTPPTEIPVQAFTPILGTLLLSPNGMVGGPARYAVVELLRRVRRADEQEDSSSRTSNREQAPDIDVQAPQRGQTTQFSGPRDHMRDGKAADDGTEIGLFGHDQRRMFEREMVQQVVIGMGRLDLPDEPMPQEVVQEEQPYSATPYPGTPMYYPGQPVVSPNGHSMGEPTPIATMQEPDSYFVLATSPFSQSSPTSPQSHSSPASSFSASAMSAVSNTILLPTLAPTPTTIPAISSPSFSPSPSIPISLSSASTASLVSSVSLSSSSSESLRSPEIRTPSGVTPAMPKVGRADEVDLAIEMPAAWAPVSSPSAPATLPQPASPAPGSPVLEGEIGIPAWLASEMPTDEAGLGLQPAAVSDLGEPIDDEEGEGLGEEAAVGRLSSMSLMAAVTASGTIGDDIKAAFVTEVERVGRDPVYWVRREATFAVGALAKVVPVEVVTLTLLPLFESLCTDATWHVRHSVLFALPAILSRLPPQKRRSLALNVILPLASDESHTVRSAVLEALGEVMYTFADEADGPPKELLDLFLGIREGEDGKSWTPDSSRPPSTRPPRSAVSDSNYSDYTGTDAGAESDIYDDPARPLVCAFNYPAVVLTLGRNRWTELRGLYLVLAKNPSFKVRRTLAASLGELAKIVGEEHAKNDLMGVWWASMRADEAEIRLKVVECLDVFVAAIGEAERREVIRGLESELTTGKLKTWREREDVAKKLEALVDIDGFEHDVLRRLLLKGLEDNVAAVREAAVSAIPAFVRSWRSRPSLLSELRTNISTLARSDSFRKRTMFVTCEQALILSDQYDIAIQDDNFWAAMSLLADDRIVDVRIRLSRLLDIIYERYANIDVSMSERIRQLAQRLAGDNSHEVQAFAHAITSGRRSNPNHLTESIRTMATFSRPPPPTPS
ncbi:ARM repeat-containing protein [Obba rivulosa]|uniref:ARM repeat-containing protein n=1 Tax=Obba rivulosa TaxID=1052685 RepID=A0A8E2DSY4_9APHY|nr:ARM repeat-containing protein [Obba rivulosa]